MDEENLGSKEPILEENTFRNWMILFYDESSNYKLADVFLALSSIKDYAYIKHEAETDEKQSHYHAFLSLSSACTQSALSKRLGIPENYLKRVKSRRGAVRYLTHIDYPNKIQYKIDDVIVSSHFKRKFLLCFEDVKTEEEILQDIYHWIDCSQFDDFYEKLKYFTMFINSECYDTIFKRYRFEIMEYLKHSV